MVKRLKIAGIYLKFVYSSNQMLLTRLRFTLWFYKSNGSLNANISTNEFLRSVYKANKRQKLHIRIHRYHSEQGYYCGLVLRWEFFFPSQAVELPFF